MKIIFEDEKIQKEYEEIKKNLIAKYGTNCSAAYFSPALLESQIDDSHEFYISVVFERKGTKASEELIEDGNNYISYLPSFEEEEVVTDEYSEIVKL